MSKIWRGIGLACLVAASLLIINTNAVQADPQPSVRVTSAVGQGIVRLDAKASGPFSYVIHHPSTDLYYIDLSGVSASSTAAAQVLGTDIVRSYRLEQYQSGDTTVSRLELLLGNGAAPQITRQGNDTLQIVVSRKNIMDAGAESTDKPRLVNAALHGSAASRAIIRQISVAKDGDAPEVLVMGSGSMNYRASRLSNPARLVLDFDNERMSAAKKTASDVDPIRDVRAAQYSPEVARVVIDLSKDAAYSVRHVDGGVAVEFSSSAPAQADAQSAASQSSASTGTDPAPASQSSPSSTTTSGAPASQSASGSPASAQDASSSTQSAANSSQTATQPSTPSTSSANASDSQSSADSSKSSATAPLAGDSAKPAGLDSPVASQSPAQSSAPTAQRSTQAAAPQNAAIPQQTAPPDQSAQQTTQDTQSQAQAAATQSATPPQTASAPVPQTASTEPAPAASASVVRQDQMSPAKYTGSPISVNLKNVDLQDFFRLVHEISGLNVVVDPSVKGTLTLVLDNVPWDQALDIVLQNNDLDKQLDGNVLRIATKDTMKKEADEQKELAKAQVEAADMVTTTRTLNYAKAGDLVDTIKKFLSPRGDVLADSRTNTLIISDIPTVLPVVDNLLRELDKKTQQVEIEARVVAANRNFSRELGSQFAFAGSANNGKNIFGGVPNVGTSPVGRFVPPLPAPPVIVGNSAPTSSSPTAVNMPLVTNLGTGVPTSGVSYAFSTANFALDYVISAAEAKGVGKLLSAPKEIVQNNEQATIKQGTKIPIQTVINNTISVQFVDAVLELQVTPQITDQGTIFLTVHVENTQIDPSIPRIQGIPALDTQAQDTRVLVSDGQTVMIGGIIVSNQQTNINEVPFVGSLPIIGQLFRHTTISTSSQELLFFVTPRILPM
ncbi:MAG TPA: type IV pilus secretin PilQ [Candidatus Acidoferrales bacterium]|nr:type IV pilus secretin PilQ [Candidatus Acidoferrales bacterium]